MTEGLATGVSRELTVAERAALQEFNAVLRGVGQQKILAQQEQRLDELVQVFTPGSNINELTLAGERVMLQNTNSVGTTKLFDTSSLSDAELQRRVFDYAGELSGGLNLTPHPTSVGVWYYRLPDSSIINVRNVSSSGAGRWTVEISGPISDVNRLPKYELKFK